MRGELVHAPPPPELLSRAWTRRLRRRRRRRIIALGTLAVVLSIVVCAVSGVFVYRTGTAGPKTPQAAAGVFLNSMAKDSINEFEQSLCKPKRYQAGAILREFNSGMVDVGQTLDDINWKITKQTKGKNAVTMDLNVTFVVVETRTQVRESRAVPMRMQAISDRGWYICEIQVLTL
jgi:hypothetical protein